MLDTVTVVTPWDGEALKGQLPQIQKLRPERKGGGVEWGTSQGESVEGSHSSKVRVRDAAASIKCDCGAVRHQRQWLCEDHQRLMASGGNPEYLWRRRPDGSGGYWEPRPGAVSLCDEKVWVPRWEGHHDRGVSVSGSLAKFIQGHNATSPYQAVDIFKLLDRFLEEWQFRYVDAICYEGMRGQPCTEIEPPWAVDPVRLIDVSRLDLAETYRVGETRRDAEEWLRGLRYSVRARKSATSDDSSGSVSGAGEDTTVYIGKHSTERTWKAYLKDVEIMKRGRHRLFDERADLREMAAEFLRGTVRLELTLRRSWLPDVGVPVQGPDIQVQMQHWDRLGKGENMRINGELPEGLAVLKPGAKWAYSLWERGENVRGHYKKPTFYKYRRLVMDATGVDIGIQRPLEGVVEPKDLDYSREFLESVHVPHEAFPVELRDVDREPVLPFG